MNAAAIVVRRGTKKLDEVVPGWALKVRLRKLDMVSPKFCVLGQVFDDFSNGIERMGLRVTPSSNAWNHGFVSGEATYDELYGEWSRVISRRQALSKKRRRKR